MANKSVCILELGCGTSVHSLSIECELLVNKEKNKKGLMRLVRINPHHQRVPEGNHVTLPIGAKKALELMEELWVQQLEQNSQKSKSNENNLKRESSGSTVITKRLKTENREENNQ
jgi:hypothetical protein